MWKLLFITTSQDIRGENNHTTIFWVIYLPRNRTSSVLRNERLARKFRLLWLNSSSQPCSLPLSKQKPSSGENTTVFSEKEGWESFADKLDSDSVINDRWEFDETFHNAADKQQLSRHVKQTVEYIDLFYPTTLLRNSQPTLTALHARESSPCFVICEKTWLLHKIFFLYRQLVSYLTSESNKKIEGGKCPLFLQERAITKTFHHLKSFHRVKFFLHLFLNSQGGVLHI